MKKCFWIFLIIAVLTGLYISNDKPLEAQDRNQKLVDFLRSNPSNSDGTINDVMLEQYNSFGEWEPTVLIFGLWNDNKGCEEIMESFKSRYPSEKYRCNPL